MKARIILRVLLKIPYKQIYLDWLKTCSKQDIFISVICGGITTYFILLILMGSEGLI